MFYRRKIIFALLEAFDGSVRADSIQSLLFLLTGQQKTPSFDFVPTAQGPYSFQLTADLGIMSNYGQVQKDVQAWIKTDPQNYTALLKEPDRKILAGLKPEYGHLTSAELLAIIFLTHPYYGLKSALAEELLSPAEMDAVKKTVQPNDATILYTIGYEGISLETYLNKLIVNDVKLLCDVRKNPLSMKFGFSKHQLEAACGRVNIDYVHIPDLGIDSEKRQNLVTQDDRDKLFRDYAKNTLNSNADAIYTVLNLLVKHRRIALTCFEADQCDCHRGTLAKAMMQLPEWEYALHHL